MTPCTPCAGMHEPFQGSFKGIDLQVLQIIAGTRLEMLSLCLFSCRSIFHSVTFIEQIYEREVAFDG